MSRAGRVLILFAVATGGSVLANAVPPAHVSRVAVAIQGAAAAAFLFVSVLSWLRYRDARDPHDLFVGVSTLALSASAALFGVGGEHVPQLLSPSNGEGPTLPTEPVAVYALQAGWLAAAICLIPSSPFRERRGRPPASPLKVLFATVGGLVLLDLILFLMSDSNYPGRAFGRTDTISRSVTAAMPSTRIWLAAATVLVLLLLAARATLTSKPPSRMLWIGAAGLCAVPVQIAMAAWPVQDLGWFQWADSLTLAVAGLLAGGILTTQRLEASSMRRATDRAAEITGGRAEIAQMVAHEIRGPVTTIRGLAQTSSRHYDRLPDPERREFLRLIEEESTRLLRIADQTSTALKVDAGTITYTMQEEDLADVVRDGVDKATTGEHPVSLALDAGIRLPLDRVRFAEAVRQLVDNAATFSPSDAPIEVRAYTDTKQAVVEVIDRGPGIPPEHRETIFRKFPSVRPSGYEEAPGTGLGLFICRAHVREHGGDVVATEGPDGGTMLRVTLPDQGEGRGR